jgi:hypothetical protein
MLKQLIKNIISLTAVIHLSYINLNFFNDECVYILKIQVFLDIRQCQLVSSYHVSKKESCLTA